MTELEFLKELKEVLYKILSNGQKYSFASINIPKKDEDFYKFAESYLIQRPKYKNEYLFDIDGENFSIKLNLDKEINKWFENNNIPKYIKDLNYSEFERVSVLLFRKLFGTNIIEEHKASGDDGIDFYGKYTGNGLEISGFTNFFETNNWYIGQVKQYTKTIGTNYIRELLGTLELARHKIWSTKIQYENLTPKPYETIVPIFLTSSRYSKIVITIAEKFNIKLLDDIDLIFWLTIIYKADLEKLKKDLVNFGK